MIRAGEFFIDANLFDDEGAPVASSRFIGELPAGQSAVDLLFFGLISHDKQADGWFVLKNLRGYRFLRGHYPDREVIPAHNGAYETKEYELDVFSSTEWDSPAKRAKIKLYEGLIEEQTSGVHGQQ